MSNSGEKIFDKKINKSQRALAVSLLSLLQKHSFQKITVNDICETALVSRATFYMHFEDKYHLLKFALMYVSKKITHDCDLESKRDLISVAVDNIYENKSLFKNLLLGDTNPELVKMLSTMFVDYISEKLKMQKKTDTDFPIPVSMLSVYIAGGIVHLFMWWIGGGFSVTKEEMTGYLTELSTMISSKC